MRYAVDSPQATRLRAGSSMKYTLVMHEAGKEMQTNPYETLHIQTHPYKTLHLKYEVLIR